MDSAKEIARNMLNAINADSKGLVASFTKGFIRLPVSLAYLGYDFFDTDNRSSRFDDKIRFAQLIKNGLSGHEILPQAIEVFTDEFVDKIDRHDVLKVLSNVSATVTGGATFTSMTGVNLGRVLLSSMLGSIISGFAISGLLAIGAEESRAVYTSLALRQRNFDRWYKLKSRGDLDLFYFLIEDVVAPYEKACDIADTNPEEFKKICKYFFEGL
ncbi:hypothetical protein [Pantoea sp. SM3]|uniref:hypothetical protein n=1 Tax=Pantoea sp. SM3 TaxID=1628192 RepID=UPI0005F7E055|nr:hypothetical protein [Pantoea sp. SM3]KJV25734.1 hypothetical protein VI01_22880 [Pantoea sp. SM3]